MKMNLKKHLVMPLTLSAMILSIGCSSTSRTPGQFVDDTTTTRRVKKALHEDPYKYDDVKIMTREGSVQLSGFVETDEQRARAEDIIRNVEGVRDVQNQITVKEDVR